MGAYTSDKEQLFQSVKYLHPQLTFHESDLTRSTYSQLGPKGLTVRGIWCPLFDPILMADPVGTQKQCAEGSLRRTACRLLSGECPRVFV